MSLTNYSNRAVSFLAMILGSLIVAHSAGPKPIGVACIGDSITLGVGAEKPYPKCLQELLGAEYDVRNFGVEAATMLSSGDKPYIKSQELDLAVQFKPNIVIIMLGTNDSKAENWRGSERLQKDLLTLVDRFRAGKRKPQVWLCTPAVVERGEWGIDAQVIQKDVVPKILAAGKALKLSVIDVNSAFNGKSGMWVDGVHLNQDGTNLVAESIRNRINPQKRK